MRDTRIYGAGEIAATDVALIGGGVIGLAIARALARRRVRVTLIERFDDFGMESSRAAAGMLAPQSEANEANAFFELACAGRELYASFAESLRAETGIDIELEKTGTLYLAFTEQDEAEIAHRYRWQKKAGLPVEWLTAEQVRALEPCVSERVRAALLFPLDVQVENRRVVKALAASIEKSNVCALLGTNVEALRIVHDRIEGVETSRGFVPAPAVVVASGAWTSLIRAETCGRSSNAPFVETKPVRGQMLCFQAQETAARHVLYSSRGYLVPRLDKRVLAGSTTEDVGFDKRVTNEGVRAIMAHAKEIAPTLIDRMQLIETWAGLRPCAADEQPVIGAATEVAGLYYATGHYRNGILLAPITGELVADLILNNAASPLIEAFSPARFHYAGVG
jgi:glycine oxidase